LEQLQGGAKPALKWGAAQSVTRAKHGTLDVGLVRQIFQVDAARLPQFIGAEVPQDGYVLVRVDAVKEGEAISDEKRGRYAQQLRQLTGEVMSNAFMADARQQASISVSLPNADPK
jgi:peptidyl-prolyl cis-trans isomerase D